MMVSMKNVVLWDVMLYASCKNRHFRGLLQKLATEVIHVRFEVFTAVTMKNVVYWVVTPCVSCKNRRFGGAWRLLHQGNKNR
jgi:hypothetical protein